MHRIFSRDGRTSTASSGLTRSRAHRRLRSSRRGQIVVLSAIMMVMLMAFVAFALDIGYLCVVRNELQRTADSAAIAATWELMDKNGPLSPTSAEALAANARAKASEYAAYNPVINEQPQLGTSDVEVGYLANPKNPSSQFSLTGSGKPNAIHLTVKRTASQNGEVPLFFARALGKQSAAAQTEATAALINNFGGFRTPADGSNLNILPFALDLTTWLDLMSGGGADTYSFNSNSKSVSSGKDGIREVNLYPQGTGSPGNRGTVDIGSSNNSTADISRQILNGISPQDMANPAMSQFNGELKFDSNGELALNGDTGISAGIKDELAAIVGQTRIIPIFSKVEAPGNNAQYTIVKFVGIRMMHVNLKGSMSSKKVIIQPANVAVTGGIPSEVAESSYFLYSPVWLVR